jgi:PhnB protein
MPKRSLAAELDQAIQALLVSPDAALSVAEPSLAPLVQIATDLRDLPRAEFKARLKSDLERKASMATPAVTPFREGFHSLTPYLIVEGAVKLIDFLKLAFGAEEKLRVPKPDGSVMHAEMRVAGSVIELADANAQFPPRPTTLHLYVPDADAVYQRAIAVGATSTAEPVDQPYGDREAGIRDPGGNDWYISTHKAAGPGQYTPEGLRAVTIYLHPKGAAELIDFLKRAFNAEESARYESPDGAIVHAKIRIGDSILEMSEAHGPYQPRPTGIHLYVPDTDSAYRQALAAGATSLTEPNDASYGDRAAAVQDPHGNSWFLATYVKKDAALP